MDKNTKCVSGSTEALINVNVVILRSDSLKVANLFVNKNNAKSFCLDNWQNDYICFRSDFDGNLFFKNCKYYVMVQTDYDKPPIRIHFSTDSIGNIISSEYPLFEF